jgi:hypothetical protein
MKRNNDKVRQRFVDLKFKISKNDVAVATHRIGKSTSMCYWWRTSAFIGRPESKKIIFVIFDLNWRAKGASPWVQADSPYRTTQRAEAA